MSETKYIRQETYVGKEAQQKIRKAKVTIVGLGALGSVASELLCRAGVGTLFLFDRDVVELQNLQRQNLYDESDINKEKAAVAKEKLQKINKDVKIISKSQSVDYKNISFDSDVVLDCTDNIQTRLLINDFCKKNNITLISASVAGAIGNVLVITKDSACYSCIFRKKADNLNCETQGILNSASHVVASLQANEAIKIIIGKKSEENLLHINLEKNTIEKLKVSKDKSCEACSKKYDYLVQSEKEEKIIDFTISLCKTKAAYTVKPKKNINLDLKKLKNEFEIVAQTQIVSVIKEGGKEIIVHNYGELIFKELDDEEQIKKIAEKIYTTAKKQP